jgi:ABC-type branched-subunit amino acid transport system ATPase component
MLELADITKRFDGHVVLDRVSFALPPGELTAIIGPNGAGKTTLLDIIGGFLAPDEGVIKLHATDLKSVKAWRRAACYITRTFQHPREITRLTGRQNVQLHFRNQTGASLANAIMFRRRWARQEEALAAKAADILSMVGISDLERRDASAMSFGQLKMLALAGALAHDGELVLLDEPFSGLDTVKKDWAAKLLEGLAARGKHVLFVEHNLQLVNLVAKRVLALDRGRVIADATPWEVLSSAELMRAYTR